LDILLYEDLVLNDADLIIPHPRMHEREFVLKPLKEIAPKALHPVLKKAIEDINSNNSGTYVK
jgi:7,8-dihydro-6-hydroxymethylpterin-pyrophosphokinase